MYDKRLRVPGWFSRASAESNGFEPSLSADSRLPLPDFRPLGRWRWRVSRPSEGAAFLDPVRHPVACDAGGGLRCHFFAPGPGPMSLQPERLLRLLRLEAPKLLRCDGGGGAVAVLLLGAAAAPRQRKQHRGPGGAGWGDDGGGQQVARNWAAAAGLPRVGAGLGGAVLPGTACATGAGGVRAAPGEIGGPPGQRLAAAPGAASGAVALALRLRRVPRPRRPQRAAAPRRRRRAAAARGAPLAAPQAPGRRFQDQPAGPESVFFGEEFYSKAFVQCLQ